MNNSKRPLEAFFLTLFEADETINYCTTLYEASSTGKVSDALALNEAPRNFFCINPLVPGAAVRRADTQVRTYRNLLLEADQGTLESQVHFARSIGLPYSTATFSGGKSIHFIISLDEPLGTIEEYRALHTNLTDVFAIADPSTKNCSRLSRTPGATRDNGVQQTLLDLRGRVSPKSLNTFLSNYSTIIKRGEERRAHAKDRKNEDLRRVKEVLASGGAWSEALGPEIEAIRAGRFKNRHNTLMAVAAKFLSAGVPAEQVQAILEEGALNSGLTADRPNTDEVQRIFDYIYERYDDAGLKQ